MYVSEEKERNGIESNYCVHIVNIDQYTALKLCMQIMGTVVLYGTCNFIQIEFLSRRQKLSIFLIWYNNNNIKNNIILFFYHIIENVYE
jgi:hypothetical protein